MRAPRILATAALVVAFVIAPTAAFAADPPPPPVTEIPQLPSTTQKVTRSATGVAMWDQVMVDMWRIMTGRTPSTTGAVVPAPAVKPITGTQALARSGAGAGGVLTAFQVGWAVGQGGLLLYSTATGTDYQQLVCSGGDWYGAANQFIMLGAGPQCSGAGQNMNSDVSTWPQYTFANGAIISFTGATAWAGGVEYYCYSLNGSWPAGYYIGFLQNGGGYATAGASWSQYGHENCGGDLKGMWGPSNTAWVNKPNVTIMSQATGQAVGGMSAGSGDPLRTLSCRIKWADGSTTTGTGSQFKESTGSIPLSSQGTGCKSAWDAKPNPRIPEKISVDSTADGVTTEISGSSVPSEVQTELGQTASKPGQGLRLEKLVNGGWSNCLTWGPDCSGWWTATNNGTVTGTYRCTFGGDVVALTECGAYRRTFDTQTANPTITNPDTGTDVGWSAQPSTGNSLNPGTGPGTGANPAADCFETGWADVANPVDWVLLPVKCALVWAFVPRPAVVETAATNAGIAWEGKPPAVLGTFLSGLALAPEPTGCAVAVTLFGITFNVIDNCPGSWMGPVTAISRIVVNIGMVILVVVVVRRQVAGMVGYDNDH